MSNFQKDPFFRTPDKNSMQNSTSFESSRRKPIFDKKDQSKLPTHRISNSDLQYSIQKQRRKTQISPESYATLRKTRIGSSLEGFVMILEGKFRQMDQLRRDNEALYRENLELKQRVRSPQKQFNFPIQIQQQQNLYNQSLHSLQSANIEYKRKIYEARKKLEKLFDETNCQELQPIIKGLYY